MTIIIINCQQPKKKHVIFKNRAHEFFKQQRMYASLSFNLHKSRLFLFLFFVNLFVKLNFKFNSFYIFKLNPKAHVYVAGA